MHIDTKVSECEGSFTQASDNYWPGWIMLQPVPDWYQPMDATSRKGPLLPNIEEPQIMIFDL